MTTRQTTKILVPTPNTVYAKVFYTLLASGKFSFSAEDWAKTIVPEGNISEVHDSHLYSQHDHLIINKLDYYLDHFPTPREVGGEISPDEREISTMVRDLESGFPGFSKLFFDAIESFQCGFFFSMPDSLIIRSFEKVGYRFVGKTPMMDPSGGMMVIANFFEFEK
jgi:hypothetical protein